MSNRDFNSTACEECDRPIVFDLETWECPDCGLVFCAFCRGQEVHECEGVEDEDPRSMGWVGGNGLP
jgi:hypothetical protein